MKFKNTFYNWLTNRFILIIRNEENFAIRNTFRFTNAKLVVIAISGFIITFFISVYLISTVLAKWFNPEYAQLQVAKKTIVLSSKVDSLAMELDRKDKYINHFKMLITGDILEKSENQVKMQNSSYTSNVQSRDISGEDSLLRAKFESEDLLDQEIAGNIFKLEGISFYPPGEGLITKKFKLADNQRNIEIATNEGLPVTSMAEGVVIHSDSRIHDNEVFVSARKINLVVKYFFHGKLNVKEGNVLNGGDVIGLVEGSDDPVIKVETWFEGRPVNPEYFVSF